MQSIDWPKTIACIAASNNRHPNTYMSLNPMNTAARRDTRQLQMYLCIYIYIYICTPVSLCVHVLSVYERECILQHRSYQWNLKVGGTPTSLCVHVTGTRNNGLPFYRGFSVTQITARCTGDPRGFYLLHNAPARFKGEE